MLNTEDILRLSHKVGCSGHWYLNLSENTLFWSEEVFRLHGLAPDAVQPTVDNAVLFYHPGDRERVAALLEETLQTGEPLSFEARILRADGEPRWVEVLGELKKSPNSNMQYLFGIFRDITENQNQRLHNERLAWLLENTEEVILITDAAGRVTWANSAFEKTTGYSLDMAQGRKPGDLLQGPETDPQTVAYMRDCLARQESFTCEVLNYSRDGSPYWMRISCQPDFDAEGELYGYNAIQTDVTQAKQIRMDLEAEIEARNRLEKQLRYLASHDELSGLPNRRYFMQCANEEIARARRYHRPLSLLIIDLDHFKAINDQYGHAVGDQVIQAFAEQCRNLVRESDTPARVGGEEFAVLLPETDHDHALQAAERLRSLVAQQSTKTEAGAITLTVSIGVATYRDGSDSVESLLREADEHLYKAKQHGRNQVSARQQVPELRTDS